MKSNYDKLFNVLRENYNEFEIEEIWALIKDYDKNKNYQPKEEVSNCCSEPVWEETDICKKCGEHCEIIDISDF